MMLLQIGSRQKLLATDVAAAERSWQLLATTSCRRPLVLRGLGLLDDGKQRTAAASAGAAATGAPSSSPACRHAVTHVHGQHRLGGEGGLASASREAFAAGLRNRMDVM